jgi:hypothetical protein
MASNRTTHVARALTARDFARILLILAAAIVFMAALNMAFGMPHPGPTFEIVPDPAGPLPF